MNQLRTKAASLAALAAVLTLLHLALLDGLGGAVWASMLPEDTVYAAQYTDTGFRKVSVGMTEAQVEAALGPPLARWSIDRSDGPDAGARWSYSPGNTHYRCRVVHFRSGRVVRKHAEFYVD